MEIIPAVFLLGKIKDVEKIRRETYNNDKIWKKEKKMKKEKVVVLNICIGIMIFVLGLTEVYLLSDTRDKYEKNQAVITVKEAKRIRDEKINEQNQEKAELIAEDFTIRKEKEEKEKENSVWDDIIDIYEEIAEYLFG